MSFFLATNWFKVVSQLIWVNVGIIRSCPFKMLISRDIYKLFYLIFDTSGFIVGCKNHKYLFSDVAFGCRKIMNTTHGCVVELLLH